MNCPSTHGAERTACTLPMRHDGLHKGGGWVWWHGNGEDHPPEGCDLCARIGRANDAHTNPGPAPEHAAEAAGSEARP